MVGGEKFLLHRARTDHLDFPGSVSVIGDSVEGADSLTMPYFDSRGVFRVYRLSAAEGELKIWRDHPGFSPALHRPLRRRRQTFGGRFELNEDEAGWNDDLKITYRRPGG